MKLKLLPFLGMFFLFFLKNGWCIDVSISFHCYSKYSATMESIDCCEINNFMIKEIKKIDRIGEENLRREEKGEVVTASNCLGS